MSSAVVAGRNTSLTPSRTGIVIGSWVALMWVIELVDQVMRGALDQFGIHAWNVASLPAVFTAPLLHALQSKRPKHRYPVTLPTRLFSILRRLLPSRWLDRILGKSV